jgi:tetrahydromethanopterin S-methyltransferase subunit C
MLALCRQCVGAIVGTVVGTLVGAVVGTVLDMAGNLNFGFQKSLM